MKRFFFTLWICSARLRDYFLRIRPNIQRRRRISNCTYVLVVPSNGLVCDVFHTHRIVTRKEKSHCQNGGCCLVCELCDISTHNQYSRRHYVHNEFACDVFLFSRLLTQSKYIWIETHSFSYLPTVAPAMIQFQFFFLEWNDFRFKFFFFFLLGILLFYSF